MVCAQFVKREQRGITGAEATRWIDLEATKSKLHQRTLEQRQPVLSPAWIDSSKDFELSWMPKQHFPMSGERLLDCQDAVLQGISEIRYQQNTLADSGFPHFGYQGIAKGISHLALENCHELFDGNRESLGRQSRHHILH